MTYVLKNLLRATYISLRSKLPSAYQIKAARMVAKEIKALKEYRYAKKIGLYQAVRGELSLHTIWAEAPLQGKYCYFPVITDEKQLIFLPATPKSAFSKNRYNIDEPDIDRELAIPIHELDILFLPLVLFDEIGNRLGMGAGFYDRTLAKGKRPLLIGIGYEFQHYSKIPADLNDIPLDAAITPKQVYWFNKN